MIRPLLIGAVTVVAAVTAGSVKLHACSCASAVSPCKETWTADAVFIGEVVANVRLTEPEVFGPHRVTFDVREVFKGVDDRLVDVFTGSGHGDCGFNFSSRGPYLVYAHRNPLTGTLNTSICSRTTVAAWAGQDLKVLRAAARQLREPALLHGRVMRSEYATARTPRVNEPLAATRVRLVGQAGSWETRTATDGRYEFRVPAGRYQLFVDIADEFYSEPDAEAGIDVRVVEASPCAPIDIHVRLNRRVRGQVVDARGLGIPFLTVELAERGDAGSASRIPKAGALTDAQGRFGFQRLGPFEYELGLTLRRYPRQGDPDPAIFLLPRTPISFGSQANVDVGTLQLPDRVVVRAIPGIVRDEADSPVPNAEVRVEAPATPWGLSTLPVFTDAHGRFLISVVAGRTYKLVAEDRSIVADRPVYRTAKSAMFDAATNAEPFRLVVR
jgi:hypothetical protein